MATNMSISNRIVLRVLNSVLHGCEFHLLHGRTLFVVGQSSSFVMNDLIPVLPEETFFIPLSEGGVNFEVLFESTSTDSVTIRELDEKGGQAHTRIATFNNVLNVGPLMIALRPEHLDWSSEVLEYSYVKTSSHMKRGKRYLPLIVGLITVVLFFSVGGMLWENPQKQATELGGLLGTDNQRFNVIPGRDKVLYVFANNDRDAIWAKQVIARGDYREPAEVINSYQENKRISSWMADNYPFLAYYRLQMDNPRQPQLWISRQRVTLDSDAIKTLSSELTKLLPYTDVVNIVLIDDTVAVRQAELELKRQDLPYSRSEQTDTVTFVIQGALNDGELLRAKNLVDDYYSQWGGRYVAFAIELKDDWLKGHSFQYGDKGYVKMSPGHWYYPKPL